MNKIKVLHALPDRIRLKVPAVRNGLTARRFEEKAKSVDGIHWMRVNSKCAGLVVRFDRNVYSEADIVDLLEQFSMEGNA